MDEDEFRVFVVGLIVSRDPWRALQVLSEHYGVPAPALRVGMPKGYKGMAGCYVSKSQTIHVRSRETLYDPRVILHEFYHHLRSVTDAHGGIEKKANEFAENFLKAYLRRFRG